MVLKVQKDYSKWAENGKWKCPDGHLFAGNGDVFIKRCRCPECGKKTFEFIPESGAEFTSREFEILYKKYYEYAEFYFKYKVYTWLDFDSLMSMISQRFLTSIVGYNPAYGAKFYTYWYRNVFQTFNAFGVKSSGASSSPSVICELCGHGVPAITKFHLSNKKLKPREGYPGHQKLHDYMEANGLDKKQFTKAYTEMFPEAHTSNACQELTADKTKNNHNSSIAVASSGSYITNDGKTIFVPEKLALEEFEACKEIAREYAPKLYQIAQNDQSRFGKCKNSLTPKEIEKFLIDTLPYMALKYNIKEISLITKYPVSECSFWSRKLKTIGSMD